jgi:hypothetical protein
MTWVPGEISIVAVDSVASGAGGAACVAFAAGFVAEQEAMMKLAAISTAGRIILNFWKDAFKHPVY